ncbi:MAG: hypothetical protein R3A48_09485 [Polyangiales bacterium]
MNQTARIAALSILAAAGCRVFASNRDYAAYRAYRYEGDDTERLAAGSRYLAAYPRGAFHAEVSRLVNGAEEDYWDAHRSSVDGLQQYLATFPQGSHVGEAQQRMRAFETARREREEERRVAEQQAAAEREAQLRATAARQRVWVRAAFNRWSRLFVGLQGWGQGVGAIVGANPTFSAAFENAPPQCRGSHCRKEYLNDFYIPVPGRSAVPRRSTFQLDMVRVGAERSVNQVMLHARNRGLTQWWESEHQEAADPADAAAREAAVRWAMDQLRAVVATAFPTAQETPAELYGPPPEAMMQGVEEDENAAPTPVDPTACVIPSQPLGTRWSAVIGCSPLNNPRALTPPSTEVMEAHARSMESDEQPVTASSCLRLDAFAALDGEGMSTDEGLAISLIPACALTPAAPARPARPARRGR